MPTHPVSADQHQGPDRVPGRLIDIDRMPHAIGGGILRRHSFASLLGRELAGDRLFDLRPVAVERRRQVVARGHRPVRPAPGRAFGVLLNVGRLILQALEKRLPIGIDRGRVPLEASIEFVDVSGVCAPQKRRKGKGGVRVLARHDCVLEGWAS